MSQALGLRCRTRAHPRQAGTCFHSGNASLPLIDRPDEPRQVWILAKRFGLDLTAFLFRERGAMWLQCARLLRGLL